MGVEIEMEQATASRTVRFWHLVQTEEVGSTGAMTDATIKVTVRVMSWLAEELMPPQVTRTVSCSPAYVEFEKAVPRGTRLSELLVVLGQEHPRLAEKISIDREGKPPLAVVTLNGKIASGRGELMAELMDGDVVGVLPIFMGG